MNTAIVTAAANELMRAVVATGCVRDEDCAMAAQIMREELTAFLTDARYADERAITLTGQSGIALASLVAKCVHRIIANQPLGV